LKKLAIISTHPIQYNAPVFKLLAERKHIEVKVFYTWENSKDGVFDKKFNRTIKWDIPLLEGYEYQFVKNTSKDQGTHHYKGMINPGLHSEIEMWNADAVLIFGWSFHSHFRAMRYFKGKIPVYFRGDSTLLDEVPGLKTLLRRIWLRFVYRFVDFALYVGTNNKNYYLKHGLDKKKLIFAPHAVENERFYNQGGNFDHRLKELRKELKIADDDIVVLFAGKFIPIKDPLILINAANKINNVKFKFIFAGNGELENEMKNLALKNKNIHFLPFQNQSNMPILYRLGDVFVLCSSSETWGLSVNEAMASERAVLCSDKAGCAVDLVKDNENGFIFKAGDLISLLDKLNKFAKDSVHHFGQYSMKQIKEYSHEKICTAVEGLIIDEIING